MSEPNKNYSTDIYIRDKSNLSCHKVSLNKVREGELLGFQPKLLILEK